MKAFFSVILAFALSTGTALAKQGGHGKQGKQFSSISPRGGQGKQGKHFSSRSLRGGQKFNRSGSKFSRGKSVKYGKWSGGNWSGDSWHYGFSGNRFIFIGGLGYPYYWGWYPTWGWSVPYAFSFGYDSYGYYPSYGYGFVYPYYWGWYPSWTWSVPYAFNYEYYSYGDYPSYGYDYGYYRDPTYGYGNGSSIAQLQRRLA